MTPLQQPAAHEPDAAVPARGQVEIWLLPFAGLADEALRHFCMALLSPGEADRAGRFALPRPQDQYIVSRALVRLVLARCCSVAPDALAFSANEFGRPHTCAPVSAQSVHFSLSHADGLVALAVSSTYEVGLDVEDTHRPIDVAGIARSYFSPAEWSAMQHLEGEALRERFFSIWTLKEAYIKALGKGLSADLAAFTVTATPDAAVVSGGPAGAPAADTWQFFRMSPTPRHRLAVAASFKPHAPLACRVHMLEDIRTLAVPANPASANTSIQT